METGILALIIGAAAVAGLFLWLGNKPSSERYTPVPNKKNYSASWL